MFSELYLIGSYMILLFLKECFAANCSSLPTWQYACEESHLTDEDWRNVHCSAKNTWNQECEVYEQVECEGNRTFIKQQWCPNQNGVHYGTAVLLSYLFGMFGIDRFYLGYYTVGLVKLFTGGFFFIGYIADCVLITLQIVIPANGEQYKLQKLFPFLMRRPHRDIL